MMKSSLSSLLFLVIKIVNCIQVVFLCLRNQRDAYESTIQDQFWNIILVRYQLLLKHYTGENNPFEVFF